MGDRSGGEGWERRMGGKGVRREGVGVEVVGEEGWGGWGGRRGGGETMGEEWERRMGEWKGEIGVGRRDGLGGWGRRRVGEKEGGEECWIVGGGVGEDMAMHTGQVIEILQVMGIAARGG